VIPVVAVAAAACLVALRAGRASGGQLACRGSLVVAMGLALAVLPAIPLGLSPFHRRSFGWGIGWIAVLLQCFGVGLVLAAGVWAALGGRAASGRPFARPRCLVVAALVAMTAGLTYRANRHVALRFNAPRGSEYHHRIAEEHVAIWHQQRRHLEQALRAGLLDEVPAGAQIQLAQEYPFWYEARWHAASFYAMHAGRVFDTLPPSVAVPTADLARLYRVRDVPLGPSVGYVVVSRPMPPGEAGEIRLFVRHPRLFRGGSTPAFLVVAQAPGAPSGPYFLRPGGDLTPIRDGPDWGLYAVRVPGQLDPDTLQLLFDPAQAAAVRRAVASATSGLRIE